MQLSEKKTYRTRDGNRTGIRVRREPDDETDYKWTDGNSSWTENGVYWRLFPNHSLDLIEEQPAERPFSYDACPLHADGRRRAVTRDGREVVLLSDQGPNSKPIVGYLCTDAAENGDLLYQWCQDGRLYRGDESWYTQTDLLIPPPPKRVVWVNLYAGGKAVYHADEMSANTFGEDLPRLGNRAHRIEIDP